MYKKIKYFFKFKKHFKGGFTKVNGRANTGHITVRSRGGGRKRKFRQILWFNLKKNLFKFFFFFKFTNFFNFLYLKKITLEFDSFKRVPVSLMQELR
jgi:hypothetical protein